MTKELTNKFGNDVESSIANFRDSNYSIENVVGEERNYRRGIGDYAKMLMLLPLFFLVNACANLNPYDIIGAAIQYRAADPKANLTDSQRLGGGIAGSLVRDSGSREYDKELVEKEKSSNGGLRIIEIVETDKFHVYYWSNGTKSWENKETGERGNW